MVVSLGWTGQVVPDRRSPRLAPGSSPLGSHGPDRSLVGRAIRDSLGRSGFSRTPSGRVTQHVTQHQSQSELAAFRFWESVGEGPDTRAEIRFFGILKRIPVNAFPREPRELRRLAMEWDESIDSMRGELGKTLPVSMQSWEPLPNGVIEPVE